MIFRSFIIALTMSFPLPGLINFSSYAQASEARFYEKHYPHGVFKLRTDKTNESIVCDCTTVENGAVKQEKKSYQTIGQFVEELPNLAPNKAAYLEIAGMWNHASAPETDEDLNEQLLRALRDNGYEEASYFNLKKYYDSDGTNFIDAIRSDGKILWTSSIIKDDRIVHKEQEFLSLEEFQKSFLDAKLAKSASIGVHRRLVQFEGAYETASAILEFLQKEGFVKAGGLSD